MDANELKALQRPLKDSYRESAEKAFVTLKTTATLDSTNVSCSVQTGRALVEAGLHPATGGDGTLACSGDMLLEALAACAGVTMRSVAVNRGIELRSGTLSVEGDLDFRGTLGIERDAPVGFREIRLRFDLDSDASETELDQLLETTERYCVVLQSLLSAPAIAVTRSETN
ncbi:MAG: OsmC family protein [Solirubrobacterales bacterium]